MHSSYTMKAFILFAITLFNSIVLASIPSSISTTVITSMSTITKLYTDYTTTTSVTTVTSTSTINAITTVPSTLSITTTLLDTTTVIASTIQVNKTNVVTSEQTVYSNVTKSSTITNYETTQLMSTSYSVIPFNVVSTSVSTLLNILIASTTETQVHYTSTTSTIVDTEFSHFVSTISKHTTTTVIDAVTSTSISRVTSTNISTVNSTIFNPNVTAIAQLTGSDGSIAILVLPTDKNIEFSSLLVASTVKETETSVTTVTAIVATITAYSRSDTLTITETVATVTAFTSSANKSNSQISPNSTDFSNIDFHRTNGANSLGAGPYNSTPSNSNNTVSNLPVPLNFSLNAPSNINQTINSSLNHLDTANYPSKNDGTSTIVSGSNPGLMGSYPLVSSLQQSTNTGQVNIPPNSLTNSQTSNINGPNAISPNGSSENQLPVAPVYNQATSLSPQMLPANLIHTPSAFPQPAYLPSNNNGIQASPVTDSSNRLPAQYASLQQHQSPSLQYNLNGTDPASGSLGANPYPTGLLLSGSNPPSLIGNAASGTVVPFADQLNGNAATSNAIGSKSRVVTPISKYEIASTGVNSSAISTISSNSDIGNQQLNPTANISKSLYSTISMIISPTNINAAPQTTVVTALIPNGNHASQSLMAGMNTAASNIPNQASIPTSNFPLMQSAGDGQIISSMQTFSAVTPHSSALSPVNYGMSSYSPSIEKFNSSLSDQLNSTYKSNFSLAGNTDTLKSIVTGLESTAVLLSGTKEQESSSSSGKATSYTWSAFSNKPLAQVSSSISSLISRPTSNTNNVRESTSTGFKDSGVSSSRASNTSSTIVASANPGELTSSISSVISSLIDSKNSLELSNSAINMAVQPSLSISTSISTITHASSTTTVAGYTETIAHKTTKLVSGAGSTVNADLSNANVTTTSLADSTSVIGGTSTGFNEGSTMVDGSTSTTAETSSALGIASSATSISSVATSGMASSTNVSPTEMTGIRYFIGGTSTTINGTPTVTGETTAVIGGTSNIAHTKPTLLNGTTTIVSGTSTLFSATSIMVGGTVAVTGGTKSFVTRSQTIVDGTSSMIDNNSTLFGGITSVVGGSLSVIGGTTTILSGTTTVTGGTTTMMSGTTTVVKELMEMVSKTSTPINSLKISVYGSTLIPTISTSSATNSLIKMVGDTIADSYMNTDHNHSELHSDLENLSSKIRTIISSQPNTYENKISETIKSSSKRGIPDSQDNGIPMNRGLAGVEKTKTSLGMNKIDTLDAISSKQPTNMSCTLQKIAVTLRDRLQRSGILSNSQNGGKDNDLAF